MEGKKISCSYALLVIILFAALAFVTVYAYIQDKTRTCSCPNCEFLDVVNNVGKVYSYADLAGYYKAEFLDLDDGYGNKVNSVYNLYLYSDGTFYYAHSLHTISGNIGTYTIEGNKIVLNTLFTHGSFAIIQTDFSKENISFNDNYEIFANSYDGLEKQNIILSRVKKYDESNNDNSLVKEKVTCSHHL